ISPSRSRSGSSLKRSIGSLSSPPAASTLRGMSAADALMKSDLSFPVRRGKVRDVYDLGENLLIVATDRISAFDCIMPNGIPDKGKILTSLSRSEEHKS